MKKLNVFSLDVKPAIPESNSLVVVDNKIYHYDNNNEEVTIGGESIDPSNYVTSTQFTTANSAMNTRVTTLETKAPLTWATITGKPATFAPTVGTTASTAKPGNYVPTTLEVVTALKAMTAGQITEIQTLLGITPA